MEAGAFDRDSSPIKTRAGWRTGWWRALRARAYCVLDDEALVRRARAADHAAFDALVARYRDRLYTLALSSLGDEGEAGDALCEMVLSAFRDIESSRANCTPGMWLYLHGFRTVFKRTNPPRSGYTLVGRSDPLAASESIAGRVQPRGHTIRRP